MSQEITLEDQKAWIKDPVTQYVLNAVKEEQKAIIEEVMSGMYVSDPIMNAAKIGEANGLNRLADISYEE